MAGNAFQGECSALMYTEYFVYSFDVMWCQGKTIFFNDKIINNNLL